MSFSSFFSIAFKALFTSRLRSLLTMLGIVIGVFVVITLVTIAEGAKVYIFEQLNSFGMGANTLAVYGAEESEEGVAGGMMTAMTKSSITTNDIKAISSQCPSVNLVVPAIYGAAELRYGNKKYQTALSCGVTAGYEKLVKNLVARGRFYTEAEDESRRRVVFIGQSVANGLFGGISPLNEKVKVNGVSFTIIGIMKKMSSMMGMDFNDMILMPLNTAEDLFDTKEVTETWVAAVNMAAVPQAQKEIKAVLLARHRKIDFQIRTAKDMLGMIDSVMGVFTMVVGAIAGISLLVGGIGIMNIMLVAVTERFREIGIRKAVGAKNRDIFLQFLVESLILAGMGGGVGIFLGAVVIIIISRIIHIGLPLSWASVFWGVMLSGFVGAAAGVYPAMRAASFSPVEALRK